MFYEETFRAGDWWCRTVPNGTWYKFSRKQLLDKINKFIIEQQYKKD